MVIGFLSLEIYIPLSHSLKEKCKRLVSIKDRLRKRYNVAFSELDFQDKWQRSILGIVTLNDKKKIVEKTLNKIIKEIEENLDGEVIHTMIKYF